MTNYLLTGGGTAGHVNPLLTVADALRDRDPKAKVFVLGTQSGLESRLVPAAGYELLIIDRLPFPRRIGFSALLFPFRIRKATRRVRQLLREKQIDVVIGFGGYVSAPAYLAARQSRVPIVIHEANALPGIANRLGNRFAAAAGKAFRSADMANTEFVGMPIRKSIVALATNRDRAKARKHFGLDPDGFTPKSSAQLSFNRLVFASAANKFDKTDQFAVNQKSVLNQTKSQRAIGSTNHSV